MYFSRAGSVALAALLAASSVLGQITTSPPIGSGITSVPSTSVVYVTNAGSDSSGAANDVAKPSLTISHAASLASALTPTTSAPVTIKVGPGTFTESSPVTFPDNVSLEGAGEDVTIISIGKLTVAGVAHLSGFSIINYSGSSNGIGATATSSGTTVTVSNVKVTASNDCVAPSNNGTNNLTMRFFSCQFFPAYDAVNILGTDANQTLEFYGCRIVGVGPGASGYTRGVVSNVGTVRWYGGSIDITGNANSVRTVGIESNGGTVEAYNVALSVAAGTGNTGAVYDINNQSGTLKVSNVVRSDGAALVTNGSITYLDQANIGQTVQAHSNILDNISAGTDSDLSITSSQVSGLFPITQISRTRTHISDPAGGTVTIPLGDGIDRDFAASANFTVAFSGAPDSTNHYYEGLIRPIISSGPITITIPTSRRVGAVTGTVTSVTCNSGNHELSWVYQNGEYWESDDCDDTRQTFSNANVTINSGVRQVAQTGTMSAVRTATLPAASAYPNGTGFFLTDESGTVTSTNKITATRAGSDTINGGTTLDIITAYASPFFQSDGSSKWTVDIRGTTRGGTGTSTAPTDAQILIGQTTSSYLPKTISGSGATITLNDTGVLTISSIPNASLSNSAITIAGTSTSLGGSITLDTITGLSSTGLVKRTGANALGIATAGTDYAAAPSGSANTPLFNNGSGGFTNGTRSGNTTTVATTTGTLTSQDCVKIDANGNLIDAGAACGSGGGGTAGSPLFSSTADGANNALSSDTSIIGTGTGSKTTAANYFSAGTQLMMVVEGTVATAATPDNLTIKIKAGSVVVGNATGVGLTGLLSGSTFKLVALVTCRTAGASGTFKVNSIFEVTGSALTPLEAKLTDTGNAVDTTGTIAWDVTAAWASTTAGDTITGTNFTMYTPGGSVATDPIFTAKGDLAVGTGSSTSAKLAVGTNNQVLTADSTQTTGTKWATPQTVGYTIQGAGPQNQPAPAQNQTYYIGQNLVISAWTSSTTEGKYDIIVPTTGTLVSYSVHVNGTGGDATNIPTTTIDYDSGTNVGSDNTHAWTFTSSAPFNYTITGLSQAVTQNHHLALKIVTPSTWTAPTACSVNWTAYITVP
jgi:hypothetical protein